MDKKKAVFEIISWCVVIVVSLILLEFFMRVYHKIAGHPTWVADTFRGYKHSVNNRFVYNFNGGRVPNITDENGFIGKGLSHEKMPSLRVMVLGDSFTEAVQVPWEQNYCSVLEGQLNDTTANVRVINAGVSGYSPIAEYQYFHRELKGFKPQVVVLQMFSNDVFEDHKARAMGIIDKDGMPVVISRFFRGHIEAPDENGLFFKFKEYLLRRSCLAESMNRFLYKQFKKTKPQKMMGSHPEYNDDNQMFIIDESSDLFKNVAFREEALADTFRYIKALRRDVEGTGAKFILMLIPHEAQLLLKKYNPHVYYYFKNLPASAFLNNRLAKFCSDEGINFLDLKTVFEGHLGDDLYWPNDGHLRPNGHQLVGTTLAQFIKQQYRHN